jgi:hypothetical protein
LLSVGVARFGTPPQFAIEIIVENFGIFGRRQLALRLVGVTSDTSAKREQKTDRPHVAADRSVNKRPGDCSRLGDFEFAVAVADTNALGKLVKQVDLETPEAFWAPARVSADAWLELMGYRRSLVADWTVLLIGHGFHHNLALQCVPRASALSIALLGSRELARRPL